MNCSLSFPTRISVFFKNALDLTVSVGHPFALFESVSKYGCCVELYVDDTLTYFASKSVNEIQAQLTSDLINVLS